MRPYLLLAAWVSLAFLPFSADAQQRSPMAPVPDWTELEKFQETITREEFIRLLDNVYAPGGNARNFIQINADTAVIRTKLVPAETWTLRFAPSTVTAKPVPRFWRPAVTLPPAPKDRPLTGARIAIDPGHLGGAWARMEERFFQIGNSIPVKEGEMTLRVAELLVPRLQALGAEVLMVRKALDPVTPERPQTLRDPALTELQRLGIVTPREAYTNPDDPTRGRTVQWQSEILFYRISEIRQRAALVNDQLRPDLTLCLHFNAEAWGDPLKPAFVPRNHFHLLLNGTYSTGELRNDDVRFEMLVKLLNRTFPEEFAASTAVAETFGKMTGLPAYTYTTPNATPVGTSPFVWARNLLANRLYQTPVVFMEPYVMNSQEVWERVQAGDYEGERMVAGQLRKSIYREYADALTEGLRVYFTKARPQ